MSTLLLRPMFHGNDGHTAALGYHLPRLSTAWNDMVDGMRFGSAGMAITCVSSVDPITLIALPRSKGRASVTRVPSSHNFGGNSPHPMPPATTGIRA